ncbi:MAG: ATP-binding domain-containing protein, partial [Christensenellales bacterium]
WITDNIFDIYFYKYKKPEVVIKLKELIFKRLYASISDKNCVKAYMNFLNSKGLKLELVGDKVKNEDAYGILFFKTFIYGVNKYENIKHLVIDEMQDYSPLQIYLLNQMFDCPKTILGDYNQTLDSNSAKNNLMDINKILAGESEVVNLNKSYRSTIEIANFFNFIGGNKNATVVSRHGEKVDFINATYANYMETLINLIEKYKEIGYNSIGIITKTNEQAKELFNKISSKNSDISLIDDNIDGYDNRTCIISAFNSKGLEFDGVIIIDNDEIYKTSLDKNLLYIASTRPLHKLSILSIEKPSRFIQEYKEKL